jgi:hypothetical protein
MPTKHKRCKIRNARSPRNRSKPNFEKLNNVSAGFDEKSFVN